MGLEIIGNVLRRFKKPLSDSVTVWALGELFDNKVLTQSDIATLRGDLKHDATIGVESIESLKSFTFGNLQFNEVKSVKTGKIHAISRCKDSNDWVILPKEGYNTPGDFIEFSCNHELYGTTKILLIGGKLFDSGFKEIHPEAFDFKCGTIIVSYRMIKGNEEEIVKLEFKRSDLQGVQ